ncbi:MAG: hypothetical protein P0S96_07570 [Simkaniaceae bacterium]|nr:hypothetical protein [Candidatus Sacchlamyda saccharinae]
MENALMGTGGDGDGGGTAGFLVSFGCCTVASLVAIGVTLGVCSKQDCDPGVLAVIYTISSIAPLVILGGACFVGGILIKDRCAGYQSLPGSSRVPQIFARCCPRQSVV